MKFWRTLAIVGVWLLAGWITEPHAPYLIWLALAPVIVILLLALRD